MIDAKTKAIKSIIIEVTGIVEDTYEGQAVVLMEKTWDAALKEAEEIVDHCFGNSEDRVDMKIQIEKEFKRLRGKQ